MLRKILKRLFRKPCYRVRENGKFAAKTKANRPLRDIVAFEEYALKVHGVRFKTTKALQDAFNQMQKIER